MRGLQIWIYTVQIVLLGMNKIMQESLLLVFDADFFRDVRIFFANDDASHLLKS